MKEFAKRYNIPIGEGIVSLTLKDLQSTIDLSRKFIAKEWSGDNARQCAKEELITILKHYGIPTNMVLYLYRKSSNASLSEVVDLMETLHKYDSNVIFGYNDSTSSNKLIAIIQPR